MRMTVNLLARRPGSRRPPTPHERPHLALVPPRPHARAQRQSQNPPTTVGTVGTGHPPGEGGGEGGADTRRAQEGSPSTHPRSRLTGWLPCVRSPARPVSLWPVGVGAGSVVVGWVVAWWSVVLGGCGWVLVGGGGRPSRPCGGRPVGVGCWGSRGLPGCGWGRGGSRPVRVGVE
jgi:hypothetical protein